MTTTQIMMLLAAIVGLMVLMASTSRRTRRSRQSSQPSARALYASMKNDGEVGRDIEDAVIGLDQVARQINGQLDTRFAKLEAVIRDADQRIDRLSRLLRAADGKPALDLTLEPEDPRKPAVSRSTVVDHRHQAIYQLADAGASPTKISQQIGKTTGEIELILALRKAAEEGVGAGEPASSITP